jgi:hypothetical protein
LPSLRGVELFLTKLEKARTISPPLVPKEEGPEA